MGYDKMIYGESREWEADGSGRGGRGEVGAKVMDVPI
jgi:hypothetical protein